MIKTGLFVLLSLFWGLQGELSAGSLAAQQAEKPSPQVGQVAPELGDVQWRQLVGKRAPSISASRGKVIVVHTWVWFCGA